MPWKLSGRTALVTGGCRGIGLAIATRLANEGCSVYVTTRSQASIESIAGQHPTLRPLMCDVCKSEEIEKAVSSITSPIGVLVNCAGVTLNKLFLRTSLEEFSAVLRTNTLGAAEMTKVVLRQPKGMLQRKDGCVMFVGSVAGECGNAGQVAYAASKAALGGMAKSLAQEYGAHGIRFNVIAPGLIAETEMGKSINTQLQAKWAERCSLKRNGTCEEVAEVVALLAASSFVTGQTIHVDGGYW